MSLLSNLPVVVKFGDFRERLEKKGKLKQFQVGKEQTSDSVIREKSYTVRKISICQPLYFYDKIIRL